MQKNRRQNSEPSASRLKDKKRRKHCGFGHSNGDCWFVNCEEATASVLERYPPDEVQRKALHKKRKFNSKR